jgi:hypothetical protein
MSAFILEETKEGVSKLDNDEIIDLDLIMEGLSGKKSDESKKDTCVSWINIPRKNITCNSINTIHDRNKVEILLDNNFTKISHIPGLKTSLFPHQQTIVRAMIDIENKREFKFIGGTSKYYREDVKMPSVYKVSTSAAILSEAVGSGKTIDIISVILYNKLPSIVSDISEMRITYSKYKIQGGNIIRKKFNNILKTTIVFVGVSVINQWISAIKTFTNLTYFSVCNVRDLDKLITLMINKSINKYDIIIVKNGKVTRSVNFPKNITIENKNRDKSTLYIYNIISNIRNFCWARVVIDDFDTIHLPTNAGLVNGLFTWYISSTRSRPHRNQPINTQFNTTAEMIMYNNYGFENIISNSLLFYNFNIRNNPEFVKKTNNISSPKFYAYVFTNANDQYIGLLGLMGNNEANEVMEMLNGDAMETAAEKIGIKTDSAADVFQIMLGKQYHQYKKSINVLEFINEEEPKQGMRIPMSKNNDPDDTYKKSDLYIRREIKYNYPNIKSLLSDTKIEYTEIRKNTGTSIERVKNNIKEGECPICLSDLNDEDEEILILKCCGIVLCGMCCFSAIFPVGRSKGTCSNCRSDVQFNSLIYLNGSFDLTQIVDEKINDSCIENNSNEIDEESRTKMSAILDIINNKKPVEQRRVDVSIHNLMKGTCIMPKCSFNKVLIFANFEETIKNIKNILDKHNIAYWKLAGTCNEIDNIVNKFTSCNKTCVMIINSIKHCSGLNLQTATDLIFTHKILNPNIETQVIGRGQRLGRQTQLKVHYVIYENEYKRMLLYKSIREIDDDDIDIINVNKNMNNGLKI